MTETCAGAGILSGAERHADAEARGPMAEPEPDYAADLAEARRRIAAEAEARTGFLDLTELHLPELPEELFALTHLRRQTRCGSHPPSKVVSITGGTTNVRGRQRHWSKPSNRAIQ